MKSCSRCNLKYSDDTLQFCLDDGALLIALADEVDEPATIFANTAAKTAEQDRISQTVLNADSSRHLNLHEQSEISSRANSLPKAEANSNLVINNQIYDQILNFAPIVVALVQNYWQWLYLNNDNSFQFPGFLWSLHFWAWLILLGAGAALCILAIQQNKNRGFAVIGLVVLAINFLLCLAPRR